ncbi:single-stranded-DNA-specific exonuclease RecJ [Maricaulis sp. W15]|uniref:single-stranded-DNA-specific exonuclease RecJ n=1 Tax=Maricaulis sp. W15 TaxID=1772333 RepID=UPI000948B1B6|nr:single-stranded-DNA-specific exonuclease RecJ [Maricaulis sp. W15]OLF78013.1 single-stranded-DNA-specific exonuclease RecJ [Maricaulis sp. W15]
MLDDNPTLTNGSPPLLGVSRSLSGKRWRLRETDESAVVTIARQQGVPDALARVIAARGITAEAAAGFLTPRLRDSFPDPSDFADMDKAASLVWDAIEAQRPMAVFADYDVDGATSAAQLIRYFRHFDRTADIYVPDRIEEGYGPSGAAFETLQARGAELVITVDCGAAAHAALEHAAGIGLDVIVIDHHLMDAAMPPAAALVNPNRSDDKSGCGHLAAAGVTFIFLAALNREGRRRGTITPNNEPDLLDWIDLAALGTICDVVPLTGVNRAITAQGLKAMGRWSHLGLRCLAEASGVEGEANTYHAGFLIGPRINAGGRVGKSDLGATLLTTEDEALARRIAGELDALNAERRSIEADVQEAALAQLEGQASERAILVAAGEGWHPGVIGVVAGRLKEKFDKPVIVIGLDRAASPPIGKGSGRSVPGVNLGGAIAAARDAGLLLSGGGHAMAGGLSIDPDRITELVAYLDDRLAPELAAAADEMALRADGVLTAGGITTELAQLLERAAPFGQGNAEPRFVLPRMRVSFAKRVGTDHVRFTLGDLDGRRVDGICFRCAETPIGEALLAAGPGLFHAFGRLKLDTWQGRERVQLHLEDLATAAE